MIKRRGLVIGAFDTAQHGFTMTAFHLQTPQVVERTVQIDGMHGSLDLTEATGEVIYKSRPLTASFELSCGNKAERDEIISDLIRAVHGKKCPILSPDHKGLLAEGRVQIDKKLSNLAHAKIDINAVCQPWLTDPHDTFLQIPIIDRSGNLISFENSYFEAELSTCTGIKIDHSLNATASLGAEQADIGKTAVFKIALEPNETYYVSASVRNRGYWRVSGTPTMPDSFNPIVTADANGYIYIWITRMQSVGYVSLFDLVCVPADTVSIARNGSFPSVLEIDSSNEELIVLGVNGRSYRHSTWNKPTIPIPAGGVPIVAFRYSVSDEESYEQVRFRRRWLG